jgi:Acetyltransferase (GNAT) domain
MVTLATPDGSTEPTSNKEVEKHGRRREARPKREPTPTPALSIFHEPWWLDIATEGRWDEVKVERGGQILGRMPFFVRQRPWPTSVMPPLTRTLGPSIATRNSNASVDFRNRLSVADELIDQLPDFVHFIHALDPRLEEAIAFVQRGYRVTTGYTFWIERGRTEEEVWAGLRDKTRNLIRRASEQLVVRPVDDARLFCEFYTRNLGAKDLDNVYGPQLMMRLVDAALERGSGSVLGAFDRDGALSAMIVLVWDGHAAYYLLSTREQQAHNGAVSLLLWEAIKMAIGKGLVFDFDGFASDNSLSFITGFGGTVKPRFVVRRTRPWYAALRAAKGRMDSLRALPRPGFLSRLSPKRGEARAG